MKKIDKEYMISAWWDEVLWRYLGKGIMMKSDRKYYIDNLRWVCILLLIPFHAAMAWNCWGEDNYIWFSANKGLSTFITLISPWYMPLLFVLAGMSARYSLQKRTVKGFVRERVKKLLLPFLIGVVTIVAGMTYYADRFHNGYTEGFFAHYRIFFTKFTDLTGYDGGWTPGHLWFVLYLFVISMVALGVIWIQKRFFQDFSCKNIKMYGIYLLGFFPAIGSLFLDIGGKSIGMYMVLYLIGYYLLAEDVIVEKIVKYRVWNLIIMMAADILNVYMFLWDENANVAFNTIMMYITLWFGILTIIGFGQIGFNFTNGITRYLTSHSFQIYIIHFVWVIAFQFYFSKVTGNTWILYVIPVVLSYVMTIVSCEILEKGKLILGKLK